MNTDYSKKHMAYPRRNALAVALALGLGCTAVAYGQDTTGAIFGNAPVEAGETVQVTGASGTSRVVQVDATGHYNIGKLPVGTYTVTLLKGGAAVATRSNVTINVGGGTEVDFASATSQNVTQLSSLEVNASTPPAIDVSSVISSTIVTADDLKKLPVQRNAESIALLAPGTVPGSGFFSNSGNGAMMVGGGTVGGVGTAPTVSFGGSSVSENAYYVNGYNTGEPYRNIGGFALPYGSIEQQQTFTGGYNAEYGRSDGGVINQVGKRGTNTWHFGGQITWSPRYLASDPDNLYYGNPTLPAPVGGESFVLADPDLPGTLRQYRKDNKSWETTYAAYVGGPLIKDTLFIFLSADTEKQRGTNVQGFFSGLVNYASNHTSHYYGKLDWNINDNNIFELTSLHSKQSAGAGQTYEWDNDTLTSGAFVTDNDKIIDNADFLIGKYTSYISDNATLSVLYGRGNFANPVIYGNKSMLPFVSGLSVQNPDYLPPGVPYIKNDQTNSSVLAPDAAQKTHGLRVDFNYQLGDHNLGVGVDNMHYEATNQGVSTSGPGYLWTYLKNYKHADVTYPYAVRRRDLTFRTNMSMDQKAYYLQDIWQVMPNLQLNLGLRNDHFTNYTDTGAAFVDEKNQWEPRLGFSWDVNGDSSFKVYGNAGRYYLALPDNAAERAANSSTYLFTYYTYTGIDENGIPTGLGLINGPISPDGETGAPKDPKQVTSANLKPEYLDEYILGVDKTLGDKWVYGAKMMYRDLKTAIDDECSPGQIATKMTSMGLNPDDYYDSLYGANYCRLINPGLTNDIRVQKNDGTYTIVSMSQSDWGYLEKAKRTTASLSLYMEHPFDGTWSGRVDYTYSYGRGNTEGQVRSDFGQGDVSKTEDWDSWQLMQGQDGELINNRRHSLRLYGAWQISPQFLASANVLIQSGTPKECLGYFGPDAHGDPTGYNAGGGGNYHWCAGQIVHPGDPGHTPWTKQVNLGLRYTPNFGHGKLAFALDVFNALDEQKLVQADPIFAAGDHVVSNTYGDGLFYEAPRFVRLSVSYDY